MLRFVHISDTHISSDPDYLPQSIGRHPNPCVTPLINALNDLPFTPDFVLHTGDVAADPVAEHYVTARELLSQIRHPVYYIPGNHDDAQALQRVLLGRTETQPTYHYSFNANGVQVVCLDSTGPAEPPSGTVDPAQLAWLRDLCAATDPRPLVVAVHHNPLPVGIPWLDDYMGLANGEELHAALYPARERIRGVFFGHIHQNVQIQRDGILYTSVPSPWYQLHAWPEQSQTVHDADIRPGFNVVTVTANQTFIRHHALPG